MQVAATAGVSCDHVTRGIREVLHLGTKVTSGQLSTFAHSPIRLREPAASVGRSDALCSQAVTCGDVSPRSQMELGGGGVYVSKDLITLHISRRHQISVYSVHVLKDI